MKIEKDRNFIQKIGQEPPWSIKPNPRIENALGERAHLYKNGLVCESQSYGIGAFSYYRRIVEEIIDELLDDIADQVPEEERQAYQDAVSEAQNKRNATEKINLIKDYLPSHLRPGGQNPLSRLHSTLSEGLHAKTDEHCLELADAIHAILTFLVREVTERKEAASAYKQAIDKLNQMGSE